MAQHIEIECKCRVCPTKVDYLRERLQQECKRSWSILKNDRYFIFENNNSKLLRVREATLNGSLTSNITYKKKYISNEGIEVNKEYESDISDFAACCDIFLSLGAKEYVLKKKQGMGFDYVCTKTNTKFIIELIEVPPLGYFFEIETLCDTNANEIVRKKHSENLISVIQYFGFLENDIEKRPYVNLLLEQKKDS